MGSARGKASDRTSTHVERPSAGSLHDQASPLDPLLELQQTVGNQAVLRLLRAGHPQAKFRHSSSGAAAFQGGGDCAPPRARSGLPRTLQKKCARCATGATCSDCGEKEELHRKAAHHSSQPAGGMIQRAPKLAAGTSATPSENQQPAGLIVEDSTREISSGQMRKTEFLSTMRNLVLPILDEAPQIGLASNASYVDKWIDESARKDSAYLEHAVIKYAPRAAGATTAQDYINAVVSQVEWGVIIWSTTGKIMGLPPTFAGDLPETAAKSSREQEEGDEESTVQRKPADGATGSDDVTAIRNELSGGSPLTGSVRGPMEKAYGTSFSNVKVHTDSKAAELSANLDARAFTIGSDIAFAAGEFKPGTLVGDALIAHELAHVAQQQGGGTSGPAKKGGVNYGSLEEDADLSAVGAMASIWGGVKEGLAGVARSAIPKLRSGLKLQRCDDDKQPKEQEKAEIPTEFPPSPPPEAAPPSPREKEIERLGGVQLGFMEQKRKAEEARLKMEAAKEAKKKGLPPPKTAPKVELGDMVKKEQEKHALKGGPTKEWDEADQPAWRALADKTWKDVLASVKGTELEEIAKGVTFNFDPETALKEGWYAWQTNTTLNVGMSWVRFAAKDPKNAWENLAHEMGGHFKYGKTYASEIMEAALSKLSEEQRKKVKGDTQNFFETYEYPETEIYSALWQRRYRMPPAGPAPESGGLHPDTNIDDKLRTMKDVLHPEVALAVLKELKQRINANNEILQRDKDFFLKKVKEVFKIDL